MCRYGHNGVNYDGYSCSRRAAVAWQLSPAGDGIKGE
jgi:hypothetical protein